MDPGGNFFGEGQFFGKGGAVDNFLSGFAGGASNASDWDKTVSFGASGATAGAIAGSTVFTGASCYATACSTSPVATPTGGFVGAGIGALLGGAFGVFVDSAETLIGGIEAGIKNATATATPIPNSAWWDGERAGEVTVKTAPNLIYHRREGALLDVRVAEYHALGVLSGGQRRYSKGQGTSVNAFWGPLPPGQRGFEFKSPVAPSTMSGFNGGAGFAWNEDSPGVLDLPGGRVAIPIEIVRIER